MTNAETAEIATKLTRDKRSFKAAEAILVALDHAKEALSEQLIDQVSRYAASNGWEVLRDNPSWISRHKPDRGIYLSPVKPQDWCLVLAFQFADLRQPYFGIQPTGAHSAAPPNLQNLKSIFDVAFGELGGKADGSWWIWWARLDVGDVWESIADGDLAKRFGEKADMLTSYLNKVADDGG